MACPSKGLTHGAVESALGGAAKQKITMQQGIPIEKAKEIVKLIKNSRTQGAGVDSGGSGAGERQGPRHVAGSHRPAEAAGFWH